MIFYLDVNLGEVMGESEITIRTAVQTDQQQLANLIHFETYIHRHLDWKTPIEWIGHQPYLVAQKGDDLVAALACPPEPPGIAWIRMFAASSVLPVEQAWQLLWPAARHELNSMGEATIFAVSIQQWFGEMLQKSGFTHSHDVVMLIWEDKVPLPKPSSSVKIRPMKQEDLEVVEAIDAKAFKKEWRNSRQGLEIALLQSQVATVAESAQGLIGYQISTPSPLGGHLARLAVLPEAQGQGVGYHIVYHLLNQFKSRGVCCISVNTQNNNFASLALYAKAGFHQTGEAYRVYEC